jgi:hypothetical protein
MKPIISTLLLPSVLFAAGCKRQDPAGPPAMLEEGKGAVLVVFQRVPGADRETWLSQITLVGNADTKALPRFPMAGQQSLLVLNVPPGFYSVVTQAWLRKHPPHAGGSLSGMEIRRGRLTILEGRLLTGEERFQPVEPLRLVRTVPWTLPRTEQFHDYIADVIKSSVKG